MQCRNRHPTDGDLLLLDDPHALDGDRRREVERHVAVCGRCAARRAELAAELSEVAALRRDGSARPAGVDRSADGARVGAEGARAHHVARERLAAALDARAVPGASGWRRLAAAARPGVPGVAAAMVVLALVMGTQLLDDFPPAGGRSSVAAPNDPAAALRLLPDRRLTPGAVRPVTAVEACRADRPLDPATDTGVLRQVFARYGIDHRRAAEYELDFLITPELGGAAEARNLWPQPYGATIWNAYVKDELERHLRRMVCAGALDLATAQRDIATDWIGAYRRYFDTSRPRRDYRRFPLTGRDREAPRGKAMERPFQPAPAATVASGSAEPEQPPRRS